MPILKIKKKEKTAGREIIFECDQCHKIYSRIYRKRLTRTKTGFFCSGQCSGCWKLNHGITFGNLYSDVNRKKAAKKRKATYSKHKDLIDKKFVDTCLRKYGVENPSQSIEIKEKKKQTVLKHYGKEHQWSVPEIRKNIHELMKKNGTYGSISKAEKCLETILYDRFGKENVKRNIIVNNWEIDFYVKTVNLYIQLDGTYWHGLDRPLSIISEQKNNRDKCIFKTVMRDKEQNIWFKSNNMHLIRITDIELKSQSKELICKGIMTHSNIDIME